MCRNVPDPSDPSRVNYYFAGMLIGVNGSDGFSHFTDDILSWASGLRLDLPMHAVVKIGAQLPHIRNLALVSLCAATRCGHRIILLAGHWIT
jgi:hypothetical protein